MKKHLRVLRTLFVKDIVDMFKNPNVLLMLALPLIFIVIYQFVDLGMSPAYLLMLGVMMNLCLTPLSVLGMMIAEEKEKLKHTPKELADIDSTLADIYYGNFSVFQSLPDAWAIDQLFPVMPVHRLTEFPSRKAVISDITCDSDGRIDKFIDPQGMRTSLDLHPLVDGDEYYLGVFLVGAYQETLGDLHNLLGDTNVVSIRISEDGSYQFVREIRGDSVADILDYVEYDPRRILEDLREAAERAVREKRITPSERYKILQTFEDGLRGYTYFER